MQIIPKKVIIWGHPLYSHTHSYIHEAYYKAFKHLNYDVYWFDDNNYPKDFNYDDCLYITEGFADKNIPINKTSCYFVMYCPSPLKYQEAKKFIDVRTTGINVKDHIYDYSVDYDNFKNVGPGCYYQEKSNTKIRLKNNYHDYVIDDYDKFYISWATNLLPHEIDFNSMYKERVNEIHYCGTISPSGVCENYSVFGPFVQECLKNNIKFIHKDPWTNPSSSEEVIKRIQQSILGIDLRGPEHVKTKIITCRVFKNISYGHLGLTNSESIYNIMDGNCIFNSDVRQLFYDGMQNKNNYDMIKKGMEYVKENHTYINRINSLLSIL